MYDSGWCLRAEYDREEAWAGVRRATESRLSQSADTTVEGGSNSDRASDALTKFLYWPLLGPTFVFCYLLRKWLRFGFGLDLDKYWLCRTRLVRAIRITAVISLFAAMSILVYIAFADYIVGPTMSAIKIQGIDFLMFCLLGAIAHFVLRLWRSNRHTTWVGAPAYGLWMACMLGVMDGLRGYVPRGQMVSFSMVGAGTMGLWLLLRPVYVMFGDMDGIEAAKAKIDLELDAAVAALESDKAQGKEGEARVHAALKKALHRHFGNDWALLPQGGLLPIEGRIPFTDIDHIAVTPQGIIAFETKDWAWDKILPVPGDDTMVERRREGQVERFKNPYRQAQMKPRHLRNSLELGPNTPIRFAVVFANSRNRLDRHLPGNMLTISTLPTWLKGVAKAGIAQINVAEMAQRIQARLDYSEQSYERFRMATDSGWSYSTMVTRRNAANNAAIAGPAVPPALVTGNNRPGVVPRWMFYSSLGVMVMAILLNDTGAFGARAADALMGPAQMAFGRTPFMEHDSITAPTVTQQKIESNLFAHRPDRHRAACRPSGRS